jgi:uncharacterized protein
MPGAIEQCLSQVEADYGCRILMACESGSRAWGFPSADSDYDVRFLYLNPLDWYLRLQEQHDTIDLALHADLDVGGWELRKALRLFAGCNIALNEWLDSPVYYREDCALRTSLLALLPQYFNPRKALHHYLSLAQQAWSAKDTTTIKVKKLFYTVRAALAGCWIERWRTMPPMQLQAMLTVGLLPPDLAKQVQSLIVSKRTMTEGSSIALTPGLEQWLDEKLTHLTGCAAMVPPLKHIDWPALNALFQDLIRTA